MRHETEDVRQETKTLRCETQTGDGSLMSCPENFTLLKLAGKLYQFKKR